MTLPERCWKTLLAVVTVSGLGCATAVRVDPGLSPRMTPDEVAQVATGHELGVAPEIQLRCTTQDKIIQIYGPAGNLITNLVWSVELAGRFWIIDDATGIILGEGGPSSLFPRAGGPGPPEVQPMSPQP